MARGQQIWYKDGSVAEAGSRGIELVWYRDGTSYGRGMALLGYRKSRCRAGVSGQGDLD